MRRAGDSIPLRLTLFTGLLVLLLLLSLFGLAAWQLRDAALDRGRAELLLRHQHVAAGLVDLFGRIERKAHEIVEQIVRSRAGPDQAGALLGARVQHDPDIGGVLWALEPADSTRPGSRVALYAGYSRQGLQVRDLVAEHDDYRQRVWFQRALSDPRPWWSQPYFNESAGGQDTVTFDLPWVGPAQRPAGLLAIDVTLDRIEQQASGLGLVRGAPGRDYSIAVPHGRVLLHSEPGIERSYSLRRAAEVSTSVTLNALRDHASGATGTTVSTIHAADGDHLVAVSTIAGTGWQLATSIAHSELLAPTARMFRQMLTLAVLAMLVFAIVLAAHVRRTLRPLRQLALVADRVAAGEFDVALPRVSRNDELGRLVAAFDRAQLSMRASIAQVRDVQQQQQRLAAELSVAGDIQRAILPDDRTFFGSRFEADLAGRLQPARTVAGDFYGFVTPAPGICFLYVGDVSGSGLGSALSMTRLCTLMPALIRNGGAPADVLVRLQDQLLQEREREPIALLLARLDLARGDLAVATIGDPACLLLHGNGGQTLLPRAPAMSADDDGPARIEPLQWRGLLHAGDRMLLLTDGVFGAADTRGPPFDAERLQVACEQHRELPPREFIAALVGDIASQHAGEPPDDIALLLLQLRHRD